MSWSVFSARLLFCLVPIALCGVSSGCLVPASRVAAYREHYRVIRERNKKLEAEVARLETQSRELQADVRDAEDELITLDRQGRTARRRLTNFESERDELYRRFGSGRVPAAVSDQLAELASLNPSLRYDASSGVAKLDTDILFDTAHAELRPEANELLTQFASILRGDEASELRLMIVGHTDDQPVTGAESNGQFPNNWHLGAERALAVSDFLGARGVREKRMGIASYGMYQPAAANNSPANRQKNRRVEIFLIAPEVPVVGWTESFTSVYR